MKSMNTKRWLLKIAKNKWIKHSQKRNLVRICLLQEIMTWKFSRHSPLTPRRLTLALASGKNMAGPNSDTLPSPCNTFIDTFYQTSYLALNLPCYHDNWTVNRTYLEYRDGTCYVLTGYLADLVYR